MTRWTKKLKINCILANKFIVVYQGVVQLGGPDPWFTQVALLRWGLVSLLYSLKLPMQLKQIFKYLNSPSHFGWQYSSDMIVNKSISLPIFSIILFSSIQKRWCPALDLNPRPPKPRCSALDHSTTLDPKKLRYVCLVKIGATHNIYFALNWLKS